MESSIDELQKYIGNLNDWLIDYKCYQDNIRVLKSVLVSICFVSMNALLLVFRVYRSVADPEIPANGACSQEGGGGGGGEGTAIVSAEKFRKMGLGFL